VMVVLLLPGLHVVVVRLYGVLVPSSLTRVPPPVLRLVPIPIR